MKIANATIISLINGITAIKDADLPVKTSYIIARNFDALMMPIVRMLPKLKSI